MGFEFGGGATATVSLRVSRHAHALHHMEACLKNNSADHRDFGYGQS